MGALGKPKTVRGALLALCLPWALHAAALNPDGQGWLRADGLWKLSGSSYSSPIAIFTVMPGPTLVQTGTGELRGDYTTLEWALQGAFPLSAAVSVRAGLAFEQVRQDWNLANAGSSLSEDLRTLDLLAPSAGFSVYPAGFWGAYRPSVEANPDGWIRWPSLDLDYSLRRTRQFYDNHTTPGNFEVVEGQERGLRTTLTLPLNAWSTLWASYERPWDWQQSLVDGSPNVPGKGGTSFSGKRPTDLPAEDEALGLRLYFAPAKPGQAWSAHLGPQGQWRVEGSFRRRLAEEAKGMRLFTRTWDFNATRALGGGWQLGLGYQVAVDDRWDMDAPGFYFDTTQPLRQSLTLHAAWAWGVPMDEATDADGFKDGVPIEPKATPDATPAAKEGEQP